MVRASISHEKFRIFIFLSSLCVFFFLLSTTSHGRKIYKKLDQTAYFRNRPSGELDELKEGIWQKLIKQKLHCYREKYSNGTNL